ncbi:hypothetical protein DCC81_24835 [Chitinophaga parva]|uniref:BppU N-terminal domain-containing protein n=1 Tax=Chitinophaga parva TaxID=2169414 RepID=A0A2T7BBR6_9BACT|nr:hypothetical protein [Chitinophaga parva]PUZ21817.1 hypothetical protein DCC81_24835 [Chitinophaga parva]
MEPIVFKQGDKIVKHIQGVDAAGQPLNWSEMQSVTVSFVNYAGVQVAFFSVESGLTINPDDNSDLQLTVDGSAGLLPGFYRYDVKMIFSNGIVKHSPTGDVQVQQSATI